MAVQTGLSPKKYYMDLRSFGPYNIFLVMDLSIYCHIDPQCHELFAIYYHCKETCIKQTPLGLVQNIQVLKLDRLNVQICQTLGLDLMIGLQSIMFLSLHLNRLNYKFFHLYMVNLTRFTIYWTHFKMTESVWNIFQLHVHVYNGKNKLHFDEMMMSALY